MPRKPQPDCALASSRIRCYRVEVARRRIPSKLSQAEARTPKGSGPFCFLSCLSCFAISGVPSPHRQGPPRRRSGGMCRKLITPVQRRRTGQRPARCPSREDTTEMEKRSSVFLHRTRAGPGHADGPPAETGRKDGAAPEPVTGHFCFSSRVSSMDQSTCLRSKGLHVRVVHVGPVSLSCCHTTEESPCASAIPRSG